MCNKYIKFDKFKEAALKLGAKYIATGHYAKLEDGYLKKAKDQNKDQTYFLSQLSKEQLENVLFPLADLDKSEVREIAKKNNLLNQDKKDSTGICFIGERHFKEFLHNYFLDQPGDIINIETQEKLGKHHGLMFYTIGQRRGLDIGGTEDRLFVVGKDLKKNILYVAEGDDNKYLKSNSCIVENMVFNSDLRPKECKAKFRYRASEYPVKITYLDDNNLLLEYDEVKAVTPGQACVLYLDDICLGGGFIKEVRKNGEKLSYLL